MLRVWLAILLALAVGASPPGGTAGIAAGAAGRPAGDGGSGHSPSWAWPVASPHPVVRPYLAPLTRYSAGHRGIDVGAPDTAVRAPADGTVHFAGTVVDRGVLSVAHTGGLLSSYEPVTTTLKAGDLVRRGDVIGTLQPGHCSTPCLHFGVRRDGEYVSPLLFLGEVPRSVLLPTRWVAAGAVAPGPMVTCAPWANVQFGSGAGVGHRVALLEPLGRDVGVDLGGAEAGVPEQLLHRPKIRSPVEQVGRGGVP